MEIQIPVLQAEDPVHINWDGESYLFFGGYDYYRLSRHPQVLEAARDTLARFGLNCGGSRVTTGNHPLHVELEITLSAFLKTEDAALLPAGYMANLALFELFKEDRSVCFYHPDCHPSLKTALCMSGLTGVEIPADTTALEKYIREHTCLPLFITDGIYSDLPPLDLYYRLAEKYKGRLLIDEAHSLGILGEHGRGAAEYFNIGGKRVIFSGSLSKAVGTAGGFVAGPKELIARIRSTCAYATTSALSLPLAAAGTASLSWLRDHPDMIRDFQRRCLNAKEQLIRAGYDIPPTPTPVISIHISDRKRTSSLKQALVDEGIYPSLIRYPGKPDYFRFALSAVHSDAEIDRLLRVLIDAISA
ncbi:MAG: pyridoxal phosphate-dependent aminotransferase family protein [FCB group bacterium]|nr:pyridoxal phosphate-dependent aminotransferase family protein [FCB group bacterium]